jgi:lysozyme
MLKEAGVFGIIAKCTQGSTIRDERFTQHITGAQAHGLEVGAYHWHDPTEPYEPQLDNLMRTVRPESGVSFIAIDVEQYWTWNEYYAAHRENRVIKQNVHGLAISEGAYKLVRSVSLRYDLPVMVYTRTSFIKDRAPQMLGWVTNFPLWLAAWPYARGKVKVTWEELRGKWLPKSSPTLPKGAEHYTFWQWSGDKFILPGLYGSTVDLNWFNGNQDEYYSWLEDGEIEPFPPEPGPVTWYTAKYRMNVRKDPGDMRVTAIVSKLEKGERIQLYQKRVIGGNTWGAIKGEGWVAEVYSGVRLLEVV